MSPFLYLALLAGLITAANVWLSRESWRNEPSDPFTLSADQQADFDAHTAAALRLVDDVAPVVPLQRRGDER